MDARPSFATYSLCELGQGTSVLWDSVSSSASGNSNSAIYHKRLLAGAKGGMGQNVFCQSKGFSPRPHWLPSLRTSASPILGISQSRWEAGPRPVRKPKREDILFYSLAHRKFQWPRLNGRFSLGSLNPKEVTQKPLALPGRVRDFCDRGGGRGVWNSMLVASGMATVNV